MEEIRQAALCYYRDSEPEIKMKAAEQFMSMDGDGDGKVSITEFTEYLKSAGCNVDKNLSRNLFEELDRDKNGVLDFEEAIVFFYISTKRMIICGGCGSFIRDVYFTCIQCFRNKSQDAYNLCCDCYASGQGRSDEHKVFLDNFTALKFIRQSIEKGQTSKRNGVVAAVAVFVAKAAARHAALHAAGAAGEVAVGAAVAGAFGPVVQGAAVLGVAKAAVVVAAVSAACSIM
ncbi:PREDICTED: uncharacterized protein LOC104609873 [Nelumbo nucifera]|uniref:Uncharacterized protein LOC104609873 n=2 Tax=Nelumbo nucifera TaxID=4432 RepID=A0A1U8B1K3_NELNU|nr:PREDICTED: uncharacterized protein LOC104609873 [Nelumbo nucifera]DAD18235.1 TPA_asm: hypothetical protein HUJ06_019698 [Nelumbo nucifera]